MEELLLSNPYYKIELDTRTELYYSKEEMRKLASHDETIFVLNGFTDAYYDYLKTHNGVAPAIPEGVTRLEISAFQHQSELREIVLPESLIRLDHFAFADCPNLSKVNIPESVLAMGNYVFEGDKSLTHISLPRRLKALFQEPFKDCNPDLLIDVMGYETMTARDFALPNASQKHLIGRFIPGYSFMETGTKKFINIFEGNRDGSDAIYSIDNDQLIAEIMASTDNPESILKENKLFNYLIFKHYLFQQAQTGPVKFPKSYIINNIDASNIKGFLANRSRWNSLIKQAKQSATPESCVDNLEKLSDSQSLSLFKLAVLCGLFEKDEGIRTKAFNLIKYNILHSAENFPSHRNYNKNLTKDPLNMRMDEIDNLFSSIPLAMPNVEFANFFSQNYSAFIDKARVEYANGEKAYIAKTLTNFGYSDELVKGKLSKGRMHDRFIAYQKANKTNGVEDLRELTDNRMNFVQFVISKGYDRPEDLKGVIADKYLEVGAKFFQYYSDIKIIKRIFDQVETSEGVLPYIIYPRDKSNIEFRDLIFNISRYGLPEKYDVIKAAFSTSEDVLEHMKYIGEQLTDTHNTKYSYKMMKKSSPDMHLSSNKLAICTVVTNRGVQPYLFELADHETQRMDIVRRTEDGEDLVGKTRMRVVDTEEYGKYLLMDNFEVMPYVRDSFPEKEQKRVFRAFLNGIQDFSKLYNQFNPDRPIRFAALGTTGTCTINPTVRKLCPTIIGDETLVLPDYFAYKNNAGGEQNYLGTPEDDDMTIASLEQKPATISISDLKISGGQGDE